MRKTKNVLFVMCDQLRADYLGCYGHPTIRTPNIDALAQRGTTFTRAYCSSPTCGPSRMSFYSGRSMFSHGAVWNFMPVSIREQMLGDLLRPLGIRVGLAGKTHFAPDLEAAERLQVPPVVMKYVSEGGFEVADRYEGHADPGGEHPYVAYLKRNGYGADPWNEHVMSAVAEDGSLASGWKMRNVHLPARVREEHSETAYTTDVAIDFIRRQGEQAWCLHLSYIKPHWPYLAPAPYHNMYGPEDCLPAVKSAGELHDPHPVFSAYMKHRESVEFAKDEVSAKVKVAYMGLVSQIDAHIGRLVESLRAMNQLDNTLIVFTSDHGDYLGDHWLGEKDLFHEASARIPMIVVDPEAVPRSRGQRSDALVEAVDFLPTALEALGSRPPSHLLEGRSLLPFTRGVDVAWRNAAVCEIDYSFREARVELGQDPRRCRGYMVRTDQWKYVFWEGFREQLFDLAEDPQELHDLGSLEATQPARAKHKDILFDWMRARKLSVTVPDEWICVSRNTIEPAHGIQIGVW